jgi:hypothetical protein
MKYAYGMRLRGFSTACQPMQDLIEVLEDTSDTFYNILLYGRKLSEVEISSYELTYIGEIDE